MNKLSILLIALCFAVSAVRVFADDFDALENLNSSQKQTLTQIQTSFKKQINDIDDNLMNYGNKIEQIKKDKNKTPEQASLLISSYERNIKSLTEQKKQLETQKDSAYKSVMTPEQYNQYKARQLSAQNAFNDFLQK